MYVYESVCVSGNIYVYVGVAKNMCVCFLSHALTPSCLDTLPDPQD